MPTNLHQPSSTAAPQRDDGFDDYMDRIEGRRDPWRRKLHVQDRDRERNSEVTLKQHRVLERKTQADMARYDEMYWQAMAKDDAKRVARTSSGGDGLADSTRNVRNVDDGDPDENNGAQLNSKHPC
jgi:predicted alpha-1,6-mannanase (GH76 family)